MFAGYWRWLISILFTSNSHCAFSVIKCRQSLLEPPQTKFEVTLWSFFCMPQPPIKDCLTEFHDQSFREFPCMVHLLFNILIYMILGVSMDFNKKILIKLKEDRTWKCNSFRLITRVDNLTLVFTCICSVCTAGVILWVLLSLLLV